MTASVRRPCPGTNVVSATAGIGPPPGIGQNVGRGDTVFVAWGRELPRSVISAGERSSRVIFRAPFAHGADVEPSLDASASDPHYVVSAARAARSIRARLRGSCGGFRSLDEQGVATAGPDAARWSSGAAVVVAFSEDGAAGAHGHELGRGRLVVDEPGVASARGPVPFERVMQGMECREGGG